jgi:hypothetical protein
VELALLVVDFLKELGAPTSHNAAGFDGAAGDTGIGKER